MDEISDREGNIDSQMVRIFPLPLTSIEKFHFFDGDEEHPNLIFGRLLFDHSVDDGLARLAWKIVTSGQPLIHSSVSRWRGKLHWTRPVSSQTTSVADQNFVLGHSDDHPSFPISPDPWFVPTPVDPAVNPGPFLMVRALGGRRKSLSTGEQLQSDQAEVWLWAHHVVCDGAAAVQFIDNWLLVYRNLAAGADAQHRVARPDYTLLSQRNKLDICSWDFLKNLPFQFIGLFGAAKFLFRNTATIAGRATPSQTCKETHFPAVVSDWLDEEALRGGSRKQTGCN